MISVYKELEHQSKRLKYDTPPWTDIPLVPHHSTFYSKRLEWFTANKHWQTLKWSYLS